MSALLEKIKSKVAKVGVIGLGYVGLPLAVENKIHLLNKYCPPDSLPPRDINFAMWLKP